KSSRGDQSSPIRENSDALYFLSIHLHDASNELVYRVRESYLIIGRSHLATLSIQDPYVSNIHATLTYEKGFIRLKDESTNGIQIGDICLKFGESRQLGDGDEFMVGNSLLKILSPHKIDRYFTL
ncbi:MAG TPA: FHA domain-containing protein, partial [Desulfobacterales bacterium]|nr:FHA domain-containing protein [Desulfobacterales bacterium]